MIVTTVTLLLKIVELVLGSDVTSNTDEIQLSGFAHELDKAALEMMENEFPHHVTRRSTYDKFDETVENIRNVSGRQTIILEKTVPRQKLIQNNPRDIQVFSLYHGEEKERKQFNGQFLYLAVAENFHGNKNLSSFVKIYEFNETSTKFQLKFQLPEYAPNRIETFTMQPDSKKTPKCFVAVGGDVDSIRSFETKLNIYEVQRNSPITFNRTFQSSMAVTALKYVSFEGENFLIVAEKLSASTSFLSTLRYNSTKATFEYHTKFPTAAISDLQTVIIRKNLYLVVAVYEDYFGRLKTKSQVYKYNSKDKTFRPHSEFDTMGAMDLELLTTSSSQYLIVSNEARGSARNKDFNVKSLIYRIDEDFRLKMVSVLDTIGAKQTSSLRLPKAFHKRLIFSIDSKDNVDQINTNLFDIDKERAVTIPITFHGNKPSTFRPQPRRVVTFMIGKEVFIALALDSENSTNIFSLRYEIQDASGPFVAAMTKAKTEMDKIEQGVAVVEEFIRNATKILKNVVYKDIRQTIYGKKTFLVDVNSQITNVSHLQITNGSIYYEEDNIRQKADAKFYNLNITVDSLEEILQEQNRTLQNCSDVFSDSCYVDCALNVTSKLTFSNVRLNSGGSVKHMVNTSFVNGIDLKRFFNDVVQQDTNEKIFGEKIFANEQIVAGDFNVSGLINGIDLTDEAVTMNGDQVINSPKVFQDGVGMEENLNLTGKLNGIEIEIEALNVNKNETISGKKIFNADLQIEHATVNHYLDDVNVTNLATDTLRQSSKDIVTGKKIFKETLLSIGNIAVSGSINGIKLRNFSEELFLLNKSPRRFAEGNLSFLDPVFINQSLEFSGTLNGIAFPAEVVLIESDQNISGHKTFDQDVSVLGNVRVNGLADGVKVEELVTLSTDQNISAKMQFAGNISLEQDLILEEGRKVDGVDISILSNNIMKVSDNQIITGVQNFENIELVQEPILKDKLDDVTLSFYEQLYNRSVLIDGDQSIMGYKMFLDDLIVKGNLSVDGNINGHKIPRSVLLKEGNQTITGNWNFTRNVYFEKDLIVNGTVSSVDVQKLQKDMIDVDSNELVKGEKYFAGNIHIEGDVTFNTTINGIDLKNDVLTKNTPQTIRGNAVNFDVVIVNNKSMFVNGDVGVASTVDGVDLSTFKRRAASTKGSIFTKNLNIQGNAIVNKIKVDSINNVTIKELADDVVTLNTDQQITSSKQLSKLRVAANLVTNSTIDNVDVGRLETQAVRVDERTNVQKEVVFNKLHFRSNVNILGLVHGKNLSYINKTVLRKTENENLKDKMSINGKMIISKNIQVGKLNGITPNEDLVLKTKNQEIRGVKTFQRGITVRGDVTVTGKINNIDLSLLASKAALKNVSQVISGKKHFLNVRAENISLKGLIDGVNLTELDHSSLRIDRDEIVHGDKDFKNHVNFKQSLLINGSINGFNLEKIYADAVTIDKEQNITGSKLFSDHLKVLGDIMIKGNMTVKGLINGFNITNLEKEILCTDGAQTVTGKKHFARTVKFGHNVTIDGLLNEVNTTNIVTVNGDQIIRGQKTFMNGIRLAGNCTVRRLVDGIDISRIYRDTLFINRTCTQIVNGTKSFLSSPWFVKDLKLLGKLDNLNISESNFHTLHSPETLLNFEFINTVHIKSNIIANQSDLGQSLERMWLKRITVGSEQNFSAVFHSNVTITNNVSSNGTVNGFELPKLEAKRLEINKTFERRNSKQISCIKIKCLALDYIDEAFEAAPLRMDYFMDYQIFHGINSQNLYHFSVNNAHFLVAAIYSDKYDKCTSSIVYKWDTEQKKFIENQKLNTSGAMNVVFFNESGDHFLFVANKDHSCGMKGPSTLYKFDVSNYLFHVHQSIETNQASDVAIFKRRNNSVLVIQNTGNVTLWKMNATDPYLSLRQKIMTSDAVAVDSFELANQTLVGIARDRNSLTAQSEISSLIYATKSRFFGPLQSIFTHGAKDIKMFKTDGQSYVAIASVIGTSSKWMTAVNSQIKIYKYSEVSQSFIFYQSIEVKDAFHLEVFEFKTQAFMVVVELNKGFTLYRHRKGMGFRSVLKVKHYGLIRTRFFEIEDQPFLALAADGFYPLKQVQHESSVSSKILKILLSGINSKGFAWQRGQC